MDTPPGAHLPVDTTQYGDSQSANIQVHAYTMIFVKNQTVCMIEVLVILIGRSTLWTSQSATDQKADDDDKLLRLS